MSKLTQTRELLGLFGILSVGGGCVGLITSGATSSNVGLLGFGLICILIGLTAPRVETEGETNV